MPTDLPINARLFSAFIKAFEAEGFTEDEAYDLAKRGAELLTSSETPSTSSPEVPADRWSTALLSNLTLSRRLVLTVLAVSIFLGAFTFLYTIFELARSVRIERNVARSSVPRDRFLHLQLSLIAILFVFFGLAIFIMPS